MNGGVVTKIQQKKSAFIRFKQSRARKDYMDYVHHVMQLKLNYEGQ